MDRELPTRRRLIQVWAEAKVVESVATAGPVVVSAVQNRCDDSSATRRSRQLTRTWRWPTNSSGSIRTTDWWSCNSCPGLITTFCGSSRTAASRNIWNASRWRRCHVCPTYCSERSSASPAKPNDSPGRWQCAQNRRSALLFASFCPQPSPTAASKYVISLLYRFTFHFFFKYVISIRYFILGLSARRRHVHRFGWQFAPEQIGSCRSSAIGWSIPSLDVRRSTWQIHSRVSC